MKNTKKIVAILCMVVFLTAGCGKVAKLKDGRDAVVKLKNGDIAVDDLYTKMKDTYALSILINMMDKQILEDKYKTDDEENKNINDQVEGVKLNFKTNEEFIQYLQQYIGVNTEDELKELLHLNYKRNKAVTDYVKGNIKDDEIEKYYNEKTVGDMKISHILIKPATTDSMTSDQKTAAENEALNKAKDLIKKLNEGADFATLAKENSADTGSASNGGSLSWVNRNQNLDEDFLNAAIKLEKGKYSAEPVKTQFGYHIIIKEDQKEKPELKTVKDDIIDTLVEEKLTDDSTLQYKALMEVRKDAKMEIQDDELKKQYNEYMDRLTKKD